MLKLLRADFRRVLNDKLFMVICIVAGAFAIITPLLYVAIFASLEGEMTEVLAMMGISINAKTMFFQTFSLSNNSGLAIPILLAVILTKDFSQGTVRNKIIGGFSRRDIFLSMLLVCFTALFGVMLVQAVLTMLVSLIFFPFAEGSFGFADFGYFMLSVLFEMLLYFFISTLICLLATRGVGATIGGYVGVVMGMSLITEILNIGVMLLAPETGLVSGSGYKVIEFIQNINVFNYVYVIGVGAKYSATEVLSCILSPLLLGSAFAALGAQRFEHKDLK